MALPSLIKNWHSDTYNSISPSRLELFITRRYIVITGGGYGLGRELVKTFAKVSISEVAILGWSEGSLIETTKIIVEKYLKTKVSHFITDITDLPAVKKAVKSFGKWNTLILNAGYMPNKGAVRSSDIPEFWKGYEVNVKGVIVALSAFLLAKGEDAIVVIISIAGITFSKNMTGGFISYNASKHALINLIKYVAIKEPEVHFINIHPDILETSMFDKFNNPDLKPNTCKFIKACVT